MRIVYFYQYFTTPGGSWGTRVYEFGKRWAAEGHQVTVVTSIYDKSDLKAKGLYSVKYFEGIKVIVLNIHLSNRHSFLKRVWSFIWYAIMSTWFALTLRAEVFIASSGPITVGIPGLAAAVLRGKKMVFEVRDLWPEGAIAMEMLKNNLARKFAFWLARTCYRKARAVVTLSPGMKQHIQQKYGYTHIHSVPNASDNELFGMETSGYQFPQWAQGKKIFLYTGNIGKVNNSWLIVRAAELLAGHPDILFLLIGEGQYKKAIQQYVSEKGLQNIRLLPLMPKTEVVAWVQRAYFALVPLEGDPILDTSSPNKLFDALAASTPVIQTTQGWIKDFLEAENCGHTVRFDDHEALAKYAVEVAAKPEIRVHMGQNAKKVAETVFDRDILTRQMLDILTSVAQKP